MTVSNGVETGGIDLVEESAHAMASWMFWVSHCLGCISRWVTLPR